MSSAILYVAIVAIWAGVLIPRWLRRDSAAGGRNSEEVTVTGVEAEAEAEAETEVEAEVQVAEERAPAPAPRRRKDTAGHEAPPARPTRAGPVPPRPASAQAEIPHGGARGQEHTKMLSSRRRLLGLLLVLTIAAGALAYTRMAAWWVVVPPAVMLLGYLTLLYEAGKVDAERRELARTRAATAATAAVAAAKRAAPPAPAAPPPAPDAEVIDISASITVAGHKFYDQHADAKLRAVGDLARGVTG